MAEEGGESIVETPLNCTKLTGLEYPGVVKNPSKMLDTLGGESVISKALKDDQQLSLRFQPDNPYCKPLQGVSSRTTSLLLKVKRRYKRMKIETDGSPFTQETGEETSSTSEYSAEILGLVDNTYKFESMCDFQYLPCCQNSDGQTESLLDKIIPSVAEDITYVDKDIPQLMLPESFSHFDVPIKYNYKRGLQHRDNPEEVESEFHAKLTKHGRAKRPNYTYIINQKDYVVPTGPHPSAVEQLVLQKPGKFEAELKKLFEERPLWSKNALKSNVDMPPTLMKGILPTVAYYFVYGPWRGLWCQFGYDPRASPEAKKYQLLDFRIRKEVTDRRLASLLRKKRSVLYPRQRVRRGTAAVTLLSNNPDRHENCDIPKEAYYIVRRGLLPAYYQMFYQLCDLQEPELQAIINNPRWQKTKCDERTGFFEVDMFKNLRNALTAIVKETLLGLDTKPTQDDVHCDSPSTSTSVPVDAGQELDEDDSDDDDNVGDNDGGDGSQEEEVEDGQGGSESENEMEMELLEYMGVETHPS